MLEQTRFLIRLSVVMLGVCLGLILAQEEPAPATKVPQELLEAFRDAARQLSQSQAQMQASQAVLQFTKDRIGKYCAKMQMVPDRTGENCIEQPKDPKDTPAK